MDIKTELNKVFRETFDDEDISVNEETTADDVEGWDSLSHLNLILAVETRFKVRFTDKEILTFKNVGDLMKSIELKIPA